MTRRSSFITQTLFLVSLFLLANTAYAGNTATVTQGTVSPSKQLNWTINNDTSGCTKTSSYPNDTDQLKNSWLTDVTHPTGFITVTQANNVGSWTFTCQDAANPSYSDTATLIVNPQPITYTSAICTQQANGTYNIALTWTAPSMGSGYVGSYNYPQRLQGPSHATGSSPSYPIGTSGGADVIGWGVTSPNDAPTGNSLTWTGITTAGTYSYWGHVYSNPGGWSAQAGGSVTCTAQTLPDLTAATPSTSATSINYGTSLMFTSSISNIGATSTGSSFSNFFQFATGSQGAGTVTDQTSSSMAALAAGSSMNATWSKTFSVAPGTYSVRACANKSSSGTLLPPGTGTFTESNWGNNCSGWVDVTVSCPSGTQWNGTSCAAVAIAEPVFSATCSASAPYSISMTWNSVSGATNYPVRIQGPSHATGDSGGFAIQQVSGADVIGMGQVGDAPTGTSITWTGLTTAGTYQYWGHAWSSTAGWSTNTVRNVTCGSVAVNGSCSATHYNCTAGSSITNAFNGTTYTWQCQGTNGGTTANCSETPSQVVNGQCSTVHYSCLAGTSINNLYNGVDTYTWDCQGSGGGTTATGCSEVVAAAPTVRVTAKTPLNTTPSSTTTETFTSSASDGNTTACRLVTSTGNTITGYNYVSGTTSVTMLSTTVPSVEGQYTYGIKCRDTGYTSATNVDYFLLNVCSAPKIWNNALNQCALPPDLTAGSVTPTSAPVNTKSFSALVTNIGSGSTGGSFYNFMQWSKTNPDTDPQAKINQFARNSDTVSVGTLAAGASATATITTTSNPYSSAATYYMRACADKRSVGDAGVINESDENNNCGAWTPICIGTAAQCPSGPPQVINQTILNNNTPSGTLQFGCLNSTSYYISRSEGATGIYPKGGTYTTTVSSPVSVAGNYQVSCSNGTATDTQILAYSTSATPPSAITLTGTPRTIEAGSKVTFSWSIASPNSSCKITATPVCTGTCSTAQTNAAAALTSTLATGTTDSNDPNGASRNMSTALQTVAPTSSTKALGKKTVQVQYTTDFGLSCGASAATSSVRVIVSTNTEG